MFTRRTVRGGSIRYPRKIVPHPGRGVLLPKMLPKMNPHEIYREIRIIQIPEKMWRFDTGLIPI